MSGDPSQVFIDVHLQGPDLYQRARARWQRGRVIVHFHAYAAVAVDDRKHRLFDFESLIGQRQQTGVFYRHRLSHRCRAAVDGPPLTQPAALRQQLVEPLDVAGLRHRHQAVAPEPPHFSFHAALFVTGRRVAVIALEAPVRTERDHTQRFLTLMAAQNFLYRAGEIVVPQQVKNAAEVSEAMFVAFQECLLRGIGIGAMERAAAEHAAHAEDLHAAHLAIQTDIAFKPIDLALLRRGVRLRHEYLSPLDVHFELAAADIFPHGRFADRVFGMLIAQPFPDAMGGMTLFPPHLLVVNEDLAR